jgi:O-antigen/teichoic acid export membrane protein
VNTIAFILIARWAGVAQAGIFSLGTTYLVIFSATSLGLDELMVRQVARDRATAGQYFRAFLILRLLFAFIGYGALYAFIGHFMGYAPTTSQPILILGLSLIPDCLNNVGGAVLAAHERFEALLAGGIIASVVKLGGGIAAIGGHFGLEGVGWAWVAGSLLGMIPVLIAAYQLIKPYRPLTGLDKKFWMDNLRLALPFLVISFLLTLEYQTDVVILSTLRDETEVGWYGAVTTLVFALTMLAQGYRAAIYPRMAYYHRTAPDKLKSLYERSFFYLGALALPMAAGLTLLSREIIHLIYGPKFASAILPLQIISWFLLFNSLNIPNARLMAVHERQNRLVSFFLGSMGINILLNLILDPTLGAIGAAIARLCSTLIFFLINYLFVTRQLQPHHLGKALARPVEAVIVMGAVVWLVRPLNLWLAISSGIFSYVFVLWLQRGLTTEEREWLSRLKKKN